MQQKLKKTAIKTKMTHDGINTNYNRVNVGKQHISTLGNAG